MFDAIIYILTGAVVGIVGTILILCAVGVLAWIVDAVITRIPVPDLVPLILSWIGKAIVWGFGLLLLGVVSYSLGKEVLG